MEVFNHKLIIELLEKEVCIQDVFLSWLFFELYNKLNRNIKIILFDIFIFKKIMAKSVSFIKVSLVN